MTSPHLFPPYHSSLLPLYPLNSFREDGNELKKLHDPKGKVRLCYHCSKSAIRGRMVSCDYCPLHWHLNCLGSASIPPARRKWRCPAHVEHATVCVLLQKSLPYLPPSLPFPFSLHLLTQAFFPAGEGSRSSLKRYQVKERPFKWPRSVRPLTGITR